MSRNELLAKAAKQIEQNLFNKAINSASAALASNVTSQGFSIRGQARLCLGQLEAALEDFSEALRLEPSAARYAYRSAVLMKMNRRAEAKKDCEDGLKMDPTCPTLHERLGHIVFDECDYDSAIEEFNVALSHVKNESTRANIFTRRAAAHFRLGERGDAFKDINYAIILGPNDPVRYATRSTMYLEIGDTESAMKDIEHALTLSPRHAGLHFQKGCVLFAQEDYQSAVDSFSEAIQLNHTDLNSYLWRAAAYLELGYINQATLDAQHILRLKPDHEDAQHLLAEIRKNGRG